MAERRPRQRTVKRLLLWTAAVAALLVGYVSIAPFVELACIRHNVPFAEPMLRVFYAPLLYVNRNPDAPGHDALEAYLIWCTETFDWFGASD